MIKIRYRCWETAQWERALSCSSCRGTEFNSQSSHGDSYSFVPPVLLTSFAHGTQGGNTFMNKINFKKIMYKCTSFLLWCESTSTYFWGDDSEPLTCFFIFFMNSDTSGVLCSTCAKDTGSQISITINF